MAQTKKTISLMQIVFAIVILLWILVCVRSMASDNREVKEDDLLQTVELAGEYSVDGNTWTDLEQGVENGLQTFYLRGHFTEDIKEGEEIWLRVEHIGLEISVNNQKIYSCNQPGSFPKMYKSPGYSFEHFISPGISTADRVEIIVISYYGNSKSVSQAFLDSIYVGDGSGLYQKLVQKITPISVVSIITLISGIALLILALIEKIYGLSNAERIAAFGFYCVSGGLWCVAEEFYPYSFLLAPNPWIASTIDLSGVLFLSISLAILLRYYMRGTITKNIMKNVLKVLLCTVCGCLLIQLLGLADLYQLQIVIVCVAMMMLNVGLVCIWLDLKKYKDTYLLLLFLSILPVFLVTIIEAFNYVSPFMPKRMLMRYGFSLSALLLIFQLASYAKQEKEKMIILQRMEQELTEARVSVMLSQIKPHFLYNALGTIRALCTKDGELARSAIDSFSRYLKGNMESLEEHHCISFQRELSHVESYLYIEKLRFADKLNIRYELKSTDFLCPPLSLQPIVENAVKHGVREKKEGGTITIATYETQDYYVIEVRDDGPGFVIGEMQKDGKSHIGIQNTRKRLASMCQGTLHIVSIEGEGTIATIQIPKRREFHEGSSSR